MRTLEANDAPEYVMSAGVTDAGVIGGRGEIGSGDVGMALMASACAFH